MLTVPNCILQIFSSKDSLFCSKCLLGPSTCPTAHLKALFHIPVFQARLGRSLKRLAEDLYSKETHFVLELIQNADDNNYDEGIQPALEFLVENDRILINNNEKGFRKEDVRV